MTTKTLKNGQPRSPRTKAERIASIRAFGETMWAPAPGTPASFLESGFRMDAETARRFEMARAAVGR